MNYEGKAEENEVGRSFSSSSSSSDCEEAESSKHEADRGGRQVKKKAGSRKKGSEPEPLGFTVQFDGNGNPKVMIRGSPRTVKESRKGKGTGRHSQSTAPKLPSSPPTQKVKNDGKPDPITAAKYSRATETEYRKAFGVKAPDNPLLPKAYLLRTPRVIERNKSCFDVQPDTDAKIDWTTTYLQDFTVKDKGEEAGAGLPTPKYAYYMPKRTVSKEKKCFDDDEDANPTLKYFINSISRK